MPLKAPTKLPFINREISWLLFNDRVLQEAHDTTVPLFERLRFMGIFSNNLDEFFRVRVASVTRMLAVDKKDKARILYNPEKVLKQIKNIVLKQQHKFEDLYSNLLLKELADEKVFILNENQLNVSRGQFVKNYFRDKILPTLVPIMIDKDKPFPFLKDRSIYFVVKLFNQDEPLKHKLALIELPTDIHSRFLVLPETNNLKYIILLDDVIRYCLEDVFHIFNFKSYEAYTIKLTRDAEIDFDLNDLQLNLLDSFTKSLKQRKRGKPVRFVYDQAMPRDILRFLKTKQHLSLDNLIPGGRYHNFKDFMSFPSLNLPKLNFTPLVPLDIESFNQSNSILTAISKADRIVHLPYQKFDYIIQFLREAAIDPKVESIKITLYRVAKESMIANALINAARNGKRVVVVLELKARFDEQNNINWTEKLMDEGVKVLHSVPNMKIHSKICLVTRKDKGITTHFANIGTGNYNEKTARIYADHSLFTANKKITHELHKVFEHLERGTISGTYSNILVSPINLRAQIEKHIKKEIHHAKQGKKASIFLKLNSLSDEKIIRLLYEASNAGVKIKIIVRGICCLVPGRKNFSENIQVISIIDRFLEHARVFCFGNAGKELMFISSADLMLRNLDMRVEVAVPIYDTKVKKEIKDILNLQWADNTKARIINKEQNNVYVNNNEVAHRSQLETYIKLKIRN
jgi:polyphosphate kinase